MGFDNYAEPLKIYLRKYREAVKGAESPAKKAKNEAKELAAVSGGNPTKKARKSNSGDVIPGGSSSSIDL